MTYIFNYKQILVFLLISFLASLVYSPAIDAPFMIEDEYDFLDITNGKLNYKSGKITPVGFKEFQKKFIDLGRYAPFSAGLKYFKAVIFPNNAKANHVILLVIAILSSFFLFLIFRNFQVNMPLSVLGTLLYLFAPFATINIRLSTGESPGNLMLFASILLIIKHVKKSNGPLLILTSLSVLFMSQCKESYTLMLPVLACVYIGYYAFYHHFDLITSFKKNILNITIIFIVPFIIGVIGILYAINARGDVFAYGGTTSYVNQFISNFIWLVKWLMPLIIFILIAIYFNIKNKQTNALIIAMLITMAWLGSQLVSYYNIQISYSQIRYLTPGCLIFLFFGILSIQQFYNYQRKIYYAGIAVIGFMLVKHAKLSYIDAGLFNANASAYNKAMDFIVNNRIESVAFYQGYEIVNSSLSQLNNRGFIPEIYASTVPYSKSENKEFDAFLLNVLKDNYGLLDFDSIINNQSKPKMMLVSIPLPDNKELPDEYIGNSFKQRILFTQTYTNVKFSDLIKPAFYKGELKNDSVSFVAYLR